MESKFDDNKMVPVPGLVFDGWEIDQTFSAGPVGRRTVTATATKGELVLKASGADADIARDMLGDMIRKHR